MSEREYTEQRFDYSEGRKDAPELIIFVGVSGSGKSTVAKEMVRRAQGKIIRLNRDSLRLMLYAGADWYHKLENLTREIMRQSAILIVQRGKDCLIDDTNCIRQTRQKWEDYAKEARLRCRIIRMTTPLDVCIERDKLRGAEMLGEGVIRHQHKDLMQLNRSTPKEKMPQKLTRPYFERVQLKEGGFVARLTNAPWVLVDVDGTLANHEGVRNKFDETRVLEDTVYEFVAEWVRALYPHYNICVVSGRHDSCGDDTCDWLEMHAIPFDRILMRHSGDNRSDVIAKQEILDELAAVIGKENIVMALDDRPRVVEMWRSNGIRVIPVRGTWLHTESCEFDQTQKGYKTCPECGALEYF